MIPDPTNRQPQPFASFVQEKRDLFVEATKVAHAMFPDLRDYRVTRLSNSETVTDATQGNLMSIFDQVGVCDTPHDYEGYVAAHVAEYHTRIDPVGDGMFAILRNGDKAVMVTLPRLALMPNPDVNDSPSKIKPADVEREIVDESYTLSPSGRTLTCELLLLNGHAESGIAYCVDASTFDFATGCKAARVEAVKGVYKILAHRKREYVKT